MCLTTALIYNGIVGLTAIVILSLIGEQFPFLLSDQIGDLGNKRGRFKKYGSCEPELQPLPPNPYA